MQETSSPGRDHHALAARFVSQRIHRLTNAGNESATKASLAKLRRGAGKEPGSLPELFSETLFGMPEALAGTGPEPSRGEWAIHIALTLFALHQQGKDIKTKPMHQTGQRLGSAMRILARKPEDESRVKRRFDQVLTADSPEELAHHLRGLVQLLKAADIPLDYASLATDLYFMQVQTARDGVRLRWGRDYYASTFTDGSDLNQETKETTEGEKENHENQ